MLIKKVYGGFRGKTAFADRFFTYYPMGGALYDKNGALIDINKSLNEKFPFTNEADFLLNNLFRTDLLTDLQKQYLRGGSVVSGSLPVPYSIIPSMNENREILDIPYY